MKKSLKNAALFVLAATTLASCNNQSKGARETKLVGSFIASEKLEGNYGSGSFNARVYQVNLFEGDVYQLISTELAYGYGMVLGTTSIMSYGTYALGTSEDGITSYSLSKASEVIFNSYSKAGGYNLSINTQTATYPAEMLAHTQGEKLYANSKEDVINEYGKGYIVYTDDGKNTFSFIKEGSEAREEVNTASGSVSAILNETIVTSHIVNNFVSPGAYGEGSWVGQVIQVNTTESNKYEFVKTEISFGYSMLLGTTTILNYGSMTKENGEDGITPFVLSDADRVVMNSFSKAGGYNLSIDTLDCEYPVEMLAHTQGEKLYANSKEDVVNEYGKGMTVYTNDAKNELSLTNPNA